MGTAVGAQSWFVHDGDPAPHRGSGRRPERTLDRAPRPQRSYIESIRRTFEALSLGISGPEPVIFRVDGRGEYRTARKLATLRARVQLQVFPNPERGPKGTPRPPEAIARDRAMFPVDQLHQLLRHTCADHKRETISFGRRLESTLGRAHLMAVWKNFIKVRSERAPDRSTPAMRLGLADTRWRWERVQSRRLFPERAKVSEFALKLYRKQWTPCLPELDLAHAA